MSRYTYAKYLVIYFLNMVPPAKSMNNPNVQKDYAELPAMGKASWDGIPMLEFTEKFFDPLCMALGSVSENGATLLSAAFGNDPGGRGPQADPHFNVASAQIRQNSANRGRRLFACILNYILASSWLFYYLQTNFRNDGVAAFRYIRAYGRLVYTSGQLRKFENEWDHLTIRSLSDWLESIKFKRSTSDPCIFMYDGGSGALVIGVYVDDIILAHDGKLFNWFVKEFTTRFRAKHLGPLYWFLGIAVDQRDDFTVTICQERYVKNLVEKYCPDPGNNIFRDHPRGSICHVTLMLNIW